ncbi:MAG TPA: GNAT family N-acetyltransferase [Candidatus Competibacteraceae bacterium]|nr:GNAT family N-acetyltransferase [Candidatus Competibacteraceae bacterium]
MTAAARATPVPAPPPAGRAQAEVQRLLADWLGRADAPPCLWLETRLPAPAADPNPQPQWWQRLDTEQGIYRTLVVRDGIHHLHSLGLLTRAYARLADGGWLLLLSAFNLDNFQDGYDGLPSRERLLAQAQRCGFELEQEARLDELLRDDLQRSPAAAQRAAELEAYRSGRRGYRLLCLRKGAAPRWRVAELREADFPAVAALFQAVFGQPMSAELWRWKYGGGRGSNVVAWAGGRLIAHYGSLSRRIAYFGRPQWACQIGDVMVEAHERGVLTRQGPFFLTAASQAEMVIGPHHIGFGFPNGRALKVGARLGLYTQVGSVCEVSWTPLATRPALWQRLRPLHGGQREQVRRAGDRLWTAMAADLGEAIVGIRDGAWLLHRYLDHPHQRYQLWLLSNRLSGRPLGLLVLRQQGERCELLDLVAPLARLPALVLAARRLAAAWGASGLHCWISSGFAHLFEACGGQAQALDIGVPNSCWVPGPPAERLRDRWWLMAGDTDFL